MTITAIIAGIAAIAALIIGYLGGHKVASAGTDKAVAQAKVATEADTRTQVAAEASQAAGEAMQKGARIREQANAQAATTAATGDDALNAQLKAEGALRD